MTRELMECVANFSEGSNQAAIERVVQAAGAGIAKVLDVHSDPDHNRSVLTLAGSPEAVGEAAFGATEACIKTLDLRGHVGAHPRIGAMDLLPFVPLRDTEMSLAVATARAVAERIWTELHVPCFFYGAAAIDGRPTDLPTLRASAFSALEPDLGQTPHPTAGAVVVGARHLLVAFNVNLQTADIQIAARVAKAVRERDGGLPHVRSMPIELHKRGIVQVSMNLTRPLVTLVGDAFDAVVRAADKEGVGVADSEIVGLVPMGALGGRNAESLRLSAMPKLLEEQLEHL